MYHIGIVCPRSAEVRALAIHMVFLGGFREQGRSSLLVEYSNKSIIIDLGVKKAITPKYYGIPPYLDLVNEDMVEAVIVSHLHEDHIAMVPALIRKGYSGPIYMTKPTYELGLKHWYRWARIFEEDGRKIYTLEDVDVTKKYAKVVDYNNEVYLEHGYFKLMPSGHVVGSSMIYLEYGDESILHLADTRIGSRTQVNPVFSEKARIVVTNASYGGEVLDDGLQAYLFVNRVSESLNNKHIVLVPVTSTGRAQEVLMILYENLDKLPSDTLILVHESIVESLRAMLKYSEYLNKRFVELVTNNTFTKYPFTYFSDEEVEEIARCRGSVVLAPDLMLMEGASRRIFEILAEKPWLTIILTGYQAPGSLGRKLAEGKKYLFIQGKGVVEVRARVERIELKMHLDLTDNLKALFKVLTRDYKAIILHHGEEPKSTHLALKLYEYFEPLKVVVPSIPSKLYIH